MTSLKFNMPYSLKISFSEDFNFYSGDTYNIDMKDGIVNSIDLKGNMGKHSYVYLKLKNSPIKLLKKYIGLYYCTDEEINIFEKVLNSINIKFDDFTFFGIKDIYTIKGNICYVKTFITSINPSSSDTAHGGNVLFKLYENTDLKLIDAKTNGKPVPPRYRYIKGNYINMVSEYYNNEGFINTFECEYFFYLHKISNYYSVKVGYSQLSEGGYYQLYVNYNKNEIKKCEFLRKVDYIKDDEKYNIILKEKFHSKNPFNILYLYLS